MTTQDIVIVLLVFLVVFSGIYINYFRENKKDKMIYESNKKSLLVFRVLTPLAIVGSLIFYFYEIGAFDVNFYFLLLGTIISFFGIGLRWYAVISLSHAFRVNVSIVEGQELHTFGVYKHIRHPSYTGYILFYIGLGVTMCNYLSILILAFLPLITVLNRIKEEEKILVSHFKEEYEEYRKMSKKLIPFIF